VNQLAYTAVAFLVMLVANTKPSASGLVVNLTSDPI
jgi:hypothetical protein